jgi:hypothetical protein
LQCFGAEHGCLQRSEIRDQKPAVRGQRTDVSEFAPSDL